jgi:acyl-homoserine-lactone acylase
MGGITIMKLLIISLTLLVLSGLPRPIHSQSTTPTEILWDSWGVPHIIALDADGAFYGFGYAQAQNHADLVLKLYGQARGRAAEYWGEDFVASDQQVRTLSIPQQGAAGYQRLAPDFRAHIDSFVAGFNTYADAHRDQIGDEWEVVLPIRGEDVIAHGFRIARYGFMGRRGLNYGREWAEGIIGSNAWAIGPNRSATGEAMLVANPHQPWSDAGLWFEAHWLLPDLNLYGAALVGSPVLGIAFNQYLGWTHTNNTRDGFDLYTLTTNAEGTAYQFDGEMRPFELRTETFSVRQPDGSLREETLTIRESIHGPVIEVRPGTDQMLALRVVAADAEQAAVQWWEMAQARNLAEFEAVLSNIRIPMFTVMYADREGNIMHYFNEQVPRRSEGDWQFWNNTTPVDDDNPALIPGDTSRYLWTIGDYLPFEALPRVVNPLSGWLQNANEPPWTTTLPLALDPADYPAYISPAPLVWPRPQQSMRLLHEDDSITFDELITYKQSTFVELTRWVLDDLIAAASSSEDELVQRAVEVLRNWDRHADAESVGAALFTAWAASYLRPLGFDAVAVPFDLNDPLNTPRGLADPAAAVVGLREVAQQLEALRLLGGGIDVAYGDAFRMRVGDYDLPASGADDALGTFRTLSFAQDRDLRFRVTQGDSYVAIIRFSDPIEARVLVSYGNASQPGSPHLGDQLPLFARKELREAWLTVEAIEANLVERVMLPPR